MGAHPTCSMPLSGCVRCGQPAKSTCLTKACDQALHSPGTQPHACTVRQLTASKSKATPATIQSLFKWQHTIMQHPHSFTQHPQTAAAAAAAMPAASCCSRLLHNTPMGSKPHSLTALHSTSTNKLLLPSHASRQLLQQVAAQHTNGSNPHKPYTAPAPASCCCCPAMPATSCCSRLLTHTNGSKPHSLTQHQHQHQQTAAAAQPS